MERDRSSFPVHIVAEVLEQVFLALLESGFHTATGGLELNNFPPCNRSIILAPITMSHVCQRWRKVALSYPKLWSFIHIDLSSHFMNLLCVQEWIKRSSSAPLTIVIGSSAFLQRREMDAETSCIVGALSSTVPRWENIYISLNADDSRSTAPGQQPISNGNRPIGSLLDPSVTRAILPPAETYLRRITIYGALPSSLHFPLNELLSSSHRLQQIGIFCHDVYRQPVMRAPTKAGAFRHLTTVKFSDVDRASALSILKCCTSALSISLSTTRNPTPLDPVDDGFTTTWTDEQQTIQLNSLLALDLTTTVENGALFLDRLSAPSLGRLHLKFYQDEPVDAFSSSDTDSRRIASSHAVSRFFSRLGCSIRHLALHYEHQEYLSPFLYPFPVIPTTRLKEGSFAGFTATSSLQLARASASTLECLYIHSDWNFRYDVRPYDGITDFPRIVQLALNLEWKGVDERWMARNFIAHASVPSLKKLQLIIPPWADYYEGYVDPGPLARILHNSNLFSRSGPRLTHLHLIDRDHALDGKHLTTFLDHDSVGPTLQTLIFEHNCAVDHARPDTIHGMRGISTLVQYLSASSSTPDGKFKLPALKSIVLLMHDRAFSDCPDGAMTSMIERRFRHAGLSFAGLELPGGHVAIDLRVQEDRGKAEVLRRNGWDIEVLRGDVHLGNWDRNCVRRRWLKKVDFVWNTFPDA